MRFDFILFVLLGLQVFLAPFSFAGAGSLPLKLSALELFSDLPSLTPIPSGIAYSVNFPLWSDGAQKNRWAFLPDGLKIKFNDYTEWNFPVGTILVKQFDFNKHVETRVSRLTAQGWELASYVWDADQKDATRADVGQSITVTSSAQPKGFQWSVPSPYECIYCHTSTTDPYHPTPGGSLGVTTAQLGPTQLSTWIEAGRFSNPPADVSTLHYYPDLKQDASHYSTHDLARAYLAVNCASCHRSGGFVPTNLDFSWTTSRQNMNAINAFPNFGNLGVQDAKIITPSSKEKSLVWLRMTNTLGEHMPYIGSTIVDPNGTQWVADWITKGAQ